MAEEKLELTLEEMAELGDLVDPDDGGGEEKFNWDEQFQRSILGMLVNDKDFLITSISLINPTFFTDNVHQLMCRVLFDHFDQYKVMPPKKFLRHEILEKIGDKEDDVKLHYLTELDLVYNNYIPGLEHRNYLIDKIVNFAKMQSLKIAFNKCIFQLKRDPESDVTWMKINELLREALLVDRDFDSGLDYFQSYEERYEQIDEENNLEVFTSGFDAIDKALLAGGLTRGEMYAWVGLSGTGKSLCLVRSAILNVTKLGKRVVYVSLEMDEKKIAERFDAQLAVVDINKLAENKDLVKKAMDEEIKGMEDPRMLIIKQFPAGAMDVNILRAYIQQLKLQEFEPDLIIVDYIGEMKDFPNLAIHDSRYRIVRDLRGFATEEDVLMLTAMQPNRSAREVLNSKDRFGGQIQGDPVIDDDNLGDSFAQIRPLDGCWSINQTSEEKKGELARIFVMKHRHGKSRFSFHIEFNPETLAITQIEQKSYSEKMKLLRHEAEVMAADLPSGAPPDGKLGKKARDQIKGDVGYQDDGPTKPEKPLQ